MRNVGTHRLRLQAFSITSSSFKFQLTSLGYEKTGPSLISQRLLGLLLGTREKWPLVDLRVPSNDPENNCRTQTRKRLSVTHFQFRANCHVLFPEPTLSHIAHQKIA